MSEYITPASNPPTTTSTKKRKSKSSINLLRFVVVRDSEIGVDYGLISLNFSRRAVSNFAAVVKNSDAIRKSHHNPDVVLDQNNRRAKLVSRGPHEAGHLSLIGCRHPRHGFVEEEDFRPRHQCARKLYAFLKTVGQGARQAV